MQDQKTEILNRVQNLNDFLEKLNDKHLKCLRVLSWFDNPGVEFEIDVYQNQSEFEKSVYFKLFRRPDFDKSDHRMFLSDEFSFFMVELFDSVRISIEEKISEVNQQIRALMISYNIHP